MANAKISELPAADALTGAEEIAVVQGGVTKRAAVQNVSGLSGDAGSIGYNPSNTENWANNTDPGNVNTALDQLAARAKSSESNTGHITTNLIVDGASTVKGQSKVADGSTAAPGIVFDNDPDTGIIRSGPNEIALVSGGTSRVRSGTNGVSLEVMQPDGSAWVEVGYRRLPWRGPTYGGIAASLHGTLIRLSGNATLPATSALAGGEVFVFYNALSSAVTIASVGADTLRLAGTTTTGTRTIAAYGECTVTYVDTGVYAATGPGVT